MTPFTFLDGYKDDYFVFIQTICTLKVWKFFSITPKNVLFWYTCATYDIISKTNLKDIKLYHFIMVCLWTHKIGQCCNNIDWRIQDFKVHMYGVKMERKIKKEPLIVIISSIHNALFKYDMIKMGGSGGSMPNDHTLSQGGGLHLCILYELFFQEG